MNGELLGGVLTRSQTEGQSRGPCGGGGLASLFSKKSDEEGAAEDELEGYLWGRCAAGPVKAPSSQHV